MNELSIYAKDGLFHNVVKQSKVMAGRYAVLEKGAHDLNLNNLLSGLDIPKEGKYPGVFCLPPVSDVEKAKGGWEVFGFRLLFLTTTYSSGDNQIKKVDRATNSSTATIAGDWNAMKNAAMNFMNAIEGVQKKAINHFRLGQQKPWRIIRVSGMQNDNLSGVMIMFDASVTTSCVYDDINIPNLLTALFADDGEFILNQSGKILFT